MGIWSVKGVYQELSAENRVLKNKRSAGCTIVSKNYFAYAKTLADSFRRVNPECDFYILIVDRDTDRDHFRHAGTSVVFLADLGIKNWQRVAFQFDILELNTNVKPTLMKRLLALAYPIVYYFDPDIFCYKSVEILDAALAADNILLTPHANSPLPDSDGMRPIDRDFLRSGTYNLGFIGVKQTPEGSRFLDWWESRCLSLGFAEPSMGLFVDQRWIDLVPSYFRGVAIFKNAGCNMAYWNLHERSISIASSGEYVVDAQGTTEALVFFHFSGIDPANVEPISKHQSRFTLAKRADLRSIFQNYATRIMENGHRRYKAEPYGFATFSNGDRISTLVRRYSAVMRTLSEDADPFAAESKTHRFTRRNRLISSLRTRKAASFNSLTVDESGSLKLKVFGRVLRIALLLLGADRFEMLNKLMRHYGVPNNQARIVFKDK